MSANQTGRPGYPAPCIECGGIDHHRPSPTCPAVLRGEGAWRDLCQTRCPENHAFLCERPTGHHLSPDPEGRLCWGTLTISVLSGPSRSGDLTWRWEDDADRHAVYELTEPRDDVPCHACGMYDEHRRWCRHHLDWRPGSRDPAACSCGQVISECGSCGACPVPTFNGRCLGCHESALERLDRENPDG